MQFSFLCSDGNNAVGDNFCNIGKPPILRKQGISWKNPQRRGGGRGLLDLIFSKKLNRPLSNVFCWQSFINCESVGTQNLGNTESWNRNPKQILSQKLKKKFSRKNHLCCKNHNIWALVSWKPHHTRNFVAKITLYSQFGQKKSPSSSFRQQQSSRSRSRGFASKRWKIQSSAWSWFMMTHTGKQNF